MNAEIRKLTKELNRVYKGSPWLGNSILSVLKGITPEAAFARPVPQRHTIAELLSHIIGWRKLLLMRLKDDNSFSVKQKETFDYTAYGNDPVTSWEKMLNVLEKQQGEIVKLLGEREDAFLREKVAKRKYNFYYLINGIIQHDIYHMGQIALLK